MKVFLPKYFLKSFFVGALSLLMLGSAWAASQPQTPEAEHEAFLTQLFAQTQTGQIQLGNEAVLQLPDNMQFLPKEQANQLAERFGNSVNQGRYGMIFPKNLDEDNAPNWWFDLNYEESGFIKDDDAKDWNADELLQNLRDGTEEQNKIRAEKGFDEIIVKDWIEKPNYDAQKHRLVWSVDVRDKKQPNGDAAVNYNTYVLGRKGFISLMLVSDDKNITQDKLLAQDLLNRIEFKEGLRYSDFNPTTDKVAEYGLAALVGGMAAKKLGLFALIAAFLAKFGKFLVLAVVPIGMVFKKVFKRQDKQD